MVEAAELIHEIQELREDGHLSDALLRHAVKRIHKSDERFDWVGVYLLRDAEEGQELWLHNYVGSATEHALIPVGTGVCGAAVAEGANKIVADVSEEENYLACDPRTASEMVILIRAGEEILGQIDIDSRQKDAFTAEDEESVHAVAEKLAEQLVSERR